MVLTRSSNGLTVSGTINTDNYKANSNSSQSFVIVSCNSTFNQKLLTAMADVTDSESIDRFICTPNYWQNKISYYRDNNRVEIFGYSADNKYDVAYTFFIKQGSSFSITIKNLCAYEGAYTNPPVYKSLDVQPSNQFVLNNTHNQGLRLIGISDKNAVSGWNRIASMLLIKDNCCLYKFLIAKSNSGSGYFSQSYIIYADTINGCLKASSFKRTSDNTTYTKFRVVKGESIDANNISICYLEAYTNNTTYSNGIYVYEEYNLNVYQLKSNYFSPNMTISAANSSDTVIGSEITTSINQI